MTGEFGSRVVQDGTVPVAPVFTRFGDAVEGNVVAGAAVELVPPCFAASFIAPAEFVPEPSPSAGAGYSAAEEFDAPWDVREEVAEPIAEADAPNAEADPIFVTATSHAGGESDTETVLPNAEGEPVAEAAGPHAEVEPIAEAAVPNAEGEPVAESAVLNAQGEAAAEITASQAAGEPASNGSEPETSEWTEAVAEGIDVVTSLAEVVPTAPVSPVAYELASRLEAIAQRLRTDGTAAVVAGMRGDRLDALLAGVFAGYLAAREADK